MRWSRRPTTLIVLGLIILLGMVLRFLRLDFQALWWDEGYSVWFAGQAVADMVRLTAEDIHPPLYYLFLRLWSLLFDLSPIPLRLFSVFVSLLAIPLAYLLGRDLWGRTVGILAALIVAINPMAIYYGQEIRMYGLATTFSLAALWTGWRWAQPGARKRFGVAYAVSLIAGLLTLYYFALLPLAQTIWVLISARRRIRAWFLALFAALLLYLPWLVYAGPRLFDYVNYKVVQDNDTPLGFLAYIGRHLSAFVAGHLEGVLAPLWPWIFLILLPVALVLFLAARSEAADGSGNRSTLLYLGLVLMVPLLVGYIQQRQAPFVPDRFERILLFAAPALWSLLAWGLQRLWQESRATAILMGVLVLVISSASLAFFYTTPRYSGRDYRPLIEQVQKGFLPSDHIFTIYPWQAGYFWAYMPESRPATIASPDPGWGGAVQESLDALLGQGGIWFPQHLSLGGELEGSVEDHLDRNAYQILNRWYGEETRLSAWQQVPPDGEWQDLDVPVSWENGVTLAEAKGTVEIPQGGNRRLALDLSWQGEEFIPPEDIIFSISLTDEEGLQWAQRDVTPFAHPFPPLEETSGPWRNPDRLILQIPAGTPPGEYDLLATLQEREGGHISIGGPNPAPYAWLGTVEVIPPDIAPLPAALSMEEGRPRQGPMLDFLGYSRSHEPLLPGDDLSLDLYWWPHRSVSPDQQLFLQILDAAGQVVAGWEGPPITWYGTSSWLPNQPLRTQSRLRIPATLTAGSYQLVTGLFDPVSGQRLAWQGRDLVELGTVEVGTRPHSFQPAQPMVRIEGLLEGGHQLVGYDLLGGESPGAPVNLRLYWLAAGATDASYRVFVHLVDESDRILDQSDPVPGAGMHPTTSWIAGETIPDPHTLTIPADASGPMHLSVGLYDPATGQRLPFVDSQGQILSDQLRLPLP